MITSRDIEIFKFINRYGKSYIEVLGQTFFPSIQNARNRINKLSKLELIGYWTTGLMTPRRAIVLRDEIKKLLEDEHNIKPKKAKLNTSTIHHNMIEQLADFYISKLDGWVERATVYEHSKKLHHIPDLIYHHPKGRIYIEVELHKKASKRYIDIFELMKKDNIIMVIYIVKNEVILKSYANTFPKWQRLYFITIDELILNIKSKNQIDPISQFDIQNLS